MANNELKRVGLVFDADGTVDFKNSLKSVSTELKNNQNEFAKTKAAYDENTSSVKKLQDQYEFCSKQTEAYRKKTELLKDSLDELKKREAENYDAMQKKRAETEKLEKELEELKNAENADADAIAKKTAEYNKSSGELEKLVKAENDYNSKIASSQANLDAASISMDKFRKAADEANKSISDGSARLDDAQKKLEKFSDKTGKIGGAMTKGITAPIAAGGAAAVAAYKKIDDYEDTITKMVGTAASTDSIEQFHKLFTSANGFNGDDVAAAVGEINTRFNVQGDELYSLSEQWLKFARATDSEVIPTVDSAQKVIEGMNLDIEDTPDLLDAVTAASQSSGLSAQSILDDLVKYGPALKSMGFDAGGAIDFLVKMEKSAADKDQVLTGLNKVLTNSMAKGQTAAEGLKEAFESYDEAGDGVDHLGNAMNTVQNALRFTVGTAEDTSKGFKDVAKNMKAYTGDARSQLMVMGLTASEAENVIAEINASGADLDDTMNALVSSVSSAGSNGNGLDLGLQNIADSWSDIKTKATGATAVTELFGTKGGAVIAEMLNDGSLMADMFSGTQEGLEATRGTVEDVDNALHGADEDIQAVMNNITDSGAQIGSALMPVIADILNQILPFIRDFSAWWSSLDDGEKKAVLGLAGIAAAIGPVITGISKMSSGLASLIGKDGILRKISSLTGTGGFLSSIVTFMTGPGGMIALIAAVVAGLVLLYQNCEPFRDFVNGILPGIASFFSSIPDWFSQLGEGIGELWEEVLKPFFSSIGEFFSDLFTNKLEQIKTFFGSIGDFFNGIYDSATNILGTLWDWITSGVTGTVNTISGIINGFVDFFRGIYETISGWISSISEGVRGAFSWAGGIAGNVADFFTGGKTTKTGKARWFADGGILTRPTVFASSGGTPFIGGEAGNEAVLPIDNLVGYMSQVNQSQTAEIVGAMREAVAAGVLSALRKYAPEVSLDGEAVGSIVDGRIRRAIG